MRLIKFSVMGLLVCAGAAQATTLVVRASGPSAAAYPPGKALPDTARIMLKANDQVILLDSRGTRTLRGPGNFSAMSTASADTSNTGTALAALVEQRGDRRVRIGAVRSGTTAVATHPSNVWSIDASKAGTVCLYDTTRAVIWRPGSDKPAAMTISGTTGSTAKLDWIAGQEVQNWPNSLPLTAGARYKIGGSGAPVEVKLAIVPTPVEDKQAIAKTFIDNGCMAQVDLLVALVDAQQKAMAAQ
jgi:hypothetical protein